MTSINSFGEVIGKPVTSKTQDAKVDQFGKPGLDNITSNSITVSWKAAKAKTSSEKLHYRVEYDGGTQKRQWQEVKEGIKVAL